MVDGYIQVAAEDLVKPECRYDQIGLWSLRSGLTWHTVTRVEIRAPRDVYIWAEGVGIHVAEDRELIRIRINPNKKKVNMSEDNKAMDGERYTRSDFDKALKLARIDRDYRIIELAEVARAQRLGYIRKTDAGKLTGDDRGKRIHLEDLAHSSNILMDLEMYSSDPNDYMYLSLDGNIKRVLKETTVYIDDTTPPEEN